MSSNDDKEPKLKKKLGFWKRLKRILCCYSESKKEEDSLHLVDDKLHNVLDHWSKQHHIKSVEQHKASELLKAQLEQYQLEIEERKHRNEDEQAGAYTDMKNKARKRKYKRHKLSDTEDKLPYELKPISYNWKAALENLGSTHPTQSIEANITATVETKQASLIKQGEKNSSTDELEKAGHLTDLLIDIMREEAQTSGATIEQTPELTVQQLAEMSRLNMKQFEHIIVENTKECLFLSLPTVEEMEKWKFEEARPGTKIRNKVKINEKPIEIRTFCPLCKPSHWNTRCASAVY